MMSVKPRVLCVDDEPNVLASFVRHLRHEFQVTIAESGAEGLQVVRDEPEPFAVIVSDYNMPGLSGIDFLQSVRRLSPDSVRMLLTGQADLSVAIKGVNEGGLWRFLTKPCPPEDLIRTLHEGNRQFQLIRGEKDILERTLSGSIKLLVELLALSSPLAFYRGSQLRQTVTTLTRRLSLEEAWQYEMAAGLSHIGCIALPPELLEKIRVRKPLSAQELDRYRNHPDLAYQLLVNIPRLESVAEMIRLQAEPSLQFSPAEPLENISPARLGAAMLRLAVAYEELIESGRSHAQSLAALRGRVGDFPPALLFAMEGEPPAKDDTGVQLVTLDELRPRMVIDRDVRAKNGVLLLNRGQEVNAIVLERLRQVARHLGVEEPIHVIEPAAIAVA